MKRMSIITVLILLAFAIGCQTRTIVGSTIVIEWDAPDLGTVPASEITYEIVYSPYPSGTMVVVATIITLEQPITFAVEGKYKVGIRTRRDVDGEVFYSEYSWSDVEGAPTPWYAAYYLMPPKVQRIRIK